MALARARDDTKILLTKYDNQYWVKIHDNELDETEIVNIYDPTAYFLGMSESETLDGFWEIDGSIGGITFLDNSNAKKNPAIGVISQAAFQVYSGKV